MKRGRAGYGFCLNLVTIAATVVLLVPAVHAGRRPPRGRSVATVAAPALPAAVSEELSRREYRFSAIDEGAWTAPNRATGLRSTVSQMGVEVVSRTAGAAGFRFALQLSAYGRMGCLASAAESVMAAADNRVELARPGIIEWFVNDKRGLEHGFDLVLPPECEDTEQPLVLAMRVDTELDPRLVDGRTLELRSPGGGAPVLQYARLEALDASGRSLPARLRAAPGLIEIEVDDRGAEYPLRIDPLMGTVGWEFESNHAEVYLAWHGVSDAGDVNGDGYDDVIVGSGDWAANGMTLGVAFVFHGSASGLSTTPDWTALGNEPGGGFGVEVSAAGDVNGDGYDDVLVAANWEDQVVPIPIVNAGRVYLFLGSADGLEASPAWSTYGGSGCETFGGGDVGYSCLMVLRDAHGDFNGDGYDDIVINTWHELPGPPYYGEVQVFEGGPSGPPFVPSWSWSGADDPFTSAASAGDVDNDGYDELLVGSFYSNGEQDEGRVLIFLGSPAGLSTTPDWTYESDVEYAYLGDNNTTIGGGWFGGTDGPSGAGDINGDGYDDVMASAIGYGDSTVWGMGAVYVWYGSESGLVDPPTIIEGTQIKRRGNPPWVGFIADPAGDINGDGYDDVTIGSPTYYTVAEECGVVWVHCGSPSGLDPYPAWSFSDPAAVFDGNYDRHVITAHGAGDVNGDGKDDLIGGMPYWDNLEQNEGRVLLWYGGCTDVDGDCRCVGGSIPDCDDSDPGLWGTPHEVLSLRFDDATTLRWRVPFDPGARAPVYDTLRSTSPADFTSADCIESDDGSDTAATVLEDPSPGELHSFLVRAENGCVDGQGPLGTSSVGVPRAGPDCP